jgi:hypothetical protein
VECQISKTTRLRPEALQDARNWSDLAGVRYVAVDRDADPMRKRTRGSPWLQLITGFSMKSEFGTMIAASVFVRMVVLRARML